MAQSTKSILSAIKDIKASMIEADTNEEKEKLKNTLQALFSKLPGND